MPRRSVVSQSLGLATVWLFGFAVGALLGAICALNVRPDPDYVRTLKHQLNGEREKVAALKQRLEQYEPPDPNANVSITP